MKIVILITGIVTVLGLIVGSFLTAVTHRLSDLKSILKGRSHCPKCKKILGFWDLIPLLSFVFLAGKCRHCNKKISLQYPLIEIATAIIFVSIYLKFNISLYSVILAIISMGLIVIVFSDIKNMLIPDEIIWLIAPLAVLNVIVSAIINQSFILLSSAIIGMAIFGGWILFLYLVSKGRWMGFGDIKLAAILGFILGSPLIYVGIFITYFIGGLFGLILIASGKKSLKDKIPFAPIMILGFFTALFIGEKILSWYLNIAV